MDNLNERKLSSFEIKSIMGGCTPEHRCSESLAGIYPRPKGHEMTGEEHLAKLKAEEKARKEAEIEYYEGEDMFHILFCPFD